MELHKNPSIELLQARNNDLEKEVATLKEQLEWFKRQIFGKRSEKIISNLNNEQLTFEGFDNEPIIAEEKPKTIAAHKRRKPQRNGQDKITLPPDLPVETIVLDLAEEEKLCQETGTALVKIGEEVTYKLAHKPGSFYLKQIIRPKYAHPQREEKGIRVAPVIDSIIPRCRADESFLADLLTKTFADHLPLYRISEMFARESIGINRKLLSQWVVRLGLGLEPLYQEMRRKVFESGNVFIDESPIHLQDTGKVKTAYMWVLVGGRESNPAYRVYDFRENHRHENAFEILEGYRGVLHCDKYGAYETLAAKKQVKWAPCWSHIRRKFFEAQTDETFRNWILRKIRYLFMLEKVAWARSEEERLRIRQQKEIPIIDEVIDRVKKRLTEGRDVPKSKMREALGYFCGLIPYLKNYTQHAYARLDNNVAERAVRPLAIGRKNWLFVGSPDGGKAAAVILSLVQTCRNLGINPREYLENMMRRFMGYNSQKLHELLPDQWLLSRKTSS